MELSPSLFELLRDRSARHAKVDEIYRNRDRQGSFESDSDSDFVDYNKSRR